MGRHTQLLHHAGMQALMSMYNAAAESLKWTSIRQDHPRQLSVQEAQKQQADT